MKKLFKQSLYLFAGLVFFASCSDDAETPAPTLNIVNASGIVTEVEKGDEVSFPLEISALEKIEKIDIMEYINGSGNTVVGYPKTANFNSSTTDNFTYKYPVGATEGTIRLVFSVTDKKGKSASKEHTLTVKVATAMTEFKNGQIVNNGAGTGYGSYNLITGETVASASTIRHIEDAGIDMALTSDKNWKKQWNAVSGTEFVMVSGDALTYANATKEAVSAAFTSGTKVAITPVLAVGTLIIAKTGTDHFLIEITAVTNTTADNNDKVEFKYKK